MLLMAVVMVCITTAWDTTAHPPGDLTLDDVMSSFGVDSYTVTLDKVSGIEQSDIMIVFQSGFNAMIYGNNNLTELATYINRDLSQEIGFNKIDYYLRL